MDAIEMLDEQHDEVSALFKKIAKTKSEEAKQNLFVEIADALAMHAAIEEKIFYPAVKAKRTEDILLESVEEHLAIKRVLADLLDMEVSDETFDAKMEVLREEVEHHVTEERTNLFPKVAKLFDEDRREELGDEMEGMMEELEGTDARFSVRGQTESAAPV